MSGTVTVNLTESGVTTVLRAYLLSVAPTGTDVILGQQNRVATPVGPYLVMTMIGRELLGTNAWSYGAATRVLRTPMELTVQVSAFGVGAGELIQVVASTWRDMYAADWFSTSGFDIAPLYFIGPRRTPFITGEKQYTEHWNIDLHMQATFVTTLPQAFATTGEVITTAVEAAYPSS